MLDNIWKPHPVLEVLELKKAGSWGSVGGITLTCIPVLFLFPWF